MKAAGKIRSRTPRRAITALALVGLLLAFLPPAVRAATGDLFGYGEIRSQNLAPFPKWTGTLDRYFRERKLEDGPCKSTRFNRCHLRDWKRFLSTIKNKDRVSQLRAVNAYMNRAPYIVDPINYGVPDYWATPRQFFIKDGDCEDYAIAKYLSMRALGLTADAMRIVVLQDENLRLAHAILAVRIGGDILILDNQIKQVVSHRRIRHYRPIYSVTEGAWFLHRR